MFVKIKFQSAKLPFYYNGKGPVDRIGNDEPRPTEQLISAVDCGNPFGTAKNPIHIEQVSNMLAAMLGERPVSTFHTPVVDGKPIRERIPELDKIARESFVKISNVFFYEKDDKERYVQESSTFRQSRCSNSKMGGTITWRKFRNRFVDHKDRLEKYIKCFSKYTLKPFDEEHYVSINEAISEIKENGKLEEFKNELGCDGFFTKTADVLRPSSKHSRFAFLSSDTYPMIILSVSGEFILDVTDEIYERLVTGRKMATYLDGGLAILEKWEETGTYCNDIIDGDFIEDEGYSKISDIDKRVE